MEQVRIGVAGLGNWGKNVVRCFSKAKGAELRMICDADAGKLAAQATLYPAAATTSDLEALLGNPELDAIALATPAPSHFSLGMRVLEAGKHLFVEKPMTLSVAEATALCAAAKRNDRTLMVGHLLEYHPSVAWMKAFLDSGELGTPLYMYSQRLNLGIVRSDENALWSLAPHDISVILYLFGATPDRVSAHGASYLQPGIEDVVFVNLHFSDGRTAQIHVSWLDPHKEREMVLVGTKSMVVFDDMSPMEPIRVYHKGADVTGKLDGPALVTVRHGDVLIPHFSGGEPLQTETQHFIDAVRQGTVPRSDGYDGLRVVQVLEAADRSLKSGGEPVIVQYEEHLKAA
ncbi:MAG: Gfo/Idh/MocA family protein [Armatimonadota bacterium]